MGEKKSPYIRFSFKRYLKKLKDRWYIILLTTVLAITIALAYTVFLTESFKDHKYYEASTKLYVDWDENIRDVVTDLQEQMTERQARELFTENFQSYVSTFIEQWQKAKVNAIIVDTNNLLASNYVRDSINESLVQNGYEELNGCDVIALESWGTSHLFTIRVDGYDDQGRIEFILNTVTDIVMSESKDRLGLTYDISVRDDVSSYRVERKEAKTGKVTYTKYLEYPDGSHETQDQSVIKYIFSSGNLSFICVGILAGVLILYIMTIRDKRIYDVTDLESVDGLQVIGRMNASIRKDYGWMGSQLGISAVKSGKRNIVITTPKKNISEFMLETLRKHAANENLTVVAAANVIDNVQTVQILGHCEGIVLLVTEGYDTIADVQAAKKLIEITNTELLGVVYVNFPKYDFKNGANGNHSGDRKAENDKNIDLKEDVKRRRREKIVEEPVEKKKKERVLKKEKEIKSEEDKTEESVDEIDLL